MRPAVASLLIGLTLLAGCGASSRDRVIVLGLDGMDPEVVDTLMAEGRLPNFARLRQGGAYGRLRSMRPILSPIIWTTIATGKLPEHHGIGAFVAVNRKTGEQLPVTSQMRHTKALWNIASDQGRRVAVVGWWATWPAETVNGAVVSDHTCYHFLFPGGATGDKVAAGTTHPPELAAEIAPMIRRPSDLTHEDVAPFVHVSREELARPFRFEDELGHFKWALATAESYRTIGLHLWHRDRPDLLLVYVEAVDSTSHLRGSPGRRWLSSSNSTPPPGTGRTRSGATGATPSPSRSPTGTSSPSTRWPTPPSQPRPSPAWARSSSTWR